MAIKVKPKKRGRPATGKDPLMGFHASSDMRAAIAKWAERQPDTPTPSEAVRRLVEMGLTVRKRSMHATGERATRARELAAKAIEKISDPSASQQERTQRRRRLTRGPQEFRQDRLDLPETKRGK